ncbi:hypothetical protein [Planctomonas psychrotolerans]|uniref:hypothetical protein n=1 Tax=Planctomonas psychrotolerans TaxID=2528712 RepID=UPI00123B4AD1|nr:hypothetical protein [Planctomonas psychrotolerans]
MRTALVEPSADLQPHERFVAASITDIDSLVARFRGADVIVHLAGYGKERPWNDIDASDPPVDSPVNKLGADFTTWPWGGRW